MEHTLAHQTNTIDKYLLSELSQEERLAFEEHMFDCPECAAKVREDFAMIADLKAVLEEPLPAAKMHSVKASGSWRDWFRPLTFAPAFAAIAFACIVGYQNLISIPGMLQPQVLDSTPFVPATRGASTQIAAVKPHAALFAASFAVASPSAFPAYACEFQASTGSPVATIDCGKHPTTEFTLSVLLPAAKFPPGGYTMILRSASADHAEISRYSFAVKYEDQ
jgi:hypothetical protein